MNITSLFIELVKISSPSGDESKMSKYLQTWLAGQGFKFQIDSVGNIYANNSKKGTPLLLCAHMDTVQPGENIKPIIKNGVITSDGTTILGADNKAAIAAIMKAVEECANRNIELLLTVKEETGGGVEFFPFNWIQSKKALVFDSANSLGGIVMRSPYIYNFDIKFTGKSSHASQPEKGINAFVPALEALSTIAVGTLDKGETTINIGLIKGGTGINTVPNSIHIQGEVRSYNKELFEKHLTSIKKTMVACAKKHKLKVELSLNGYCAGYTHKKDNVFIQDISKLYLSLGLKVTYHVFSGISDANVLNEKGIATFNLTDGTKYPHTTEEQIKVADLEKLGEIVKKCITKL